MLTLPISLDISSIRAIHLALRVLQTGGQVHTYTTTIGGGYILRIHEVSAFLQHVFIKSLRRQRNSYSHCTKVEKHSHLGRGHGSDRNQRGSWDLSARHTHPPCCPHIHCPPIRERNPCFILKIFASQSYCSVGFLYIYHESLEVDLVWGLLVHDSDGVNKGRHIYPGIRLPTIMTHTSCIFVVCNINYTDNLLFGTISVHLI